MSTRTSQHRVQAARVAIEAYATKQDSGSQSLEETITDLLTDLQHLADDEKISIADCLRLSELHFQSENDETHNGWSNYETWLVHLWLTNSYRTYYHWRGQARWYLNTTVESEFVLDEIWTKDEAIVYRLADELRESLEEATPTMDPSVFSDLLRVAIWSVNWTAIAQAFIDEEK